MKKTILAPNGAKITFKSKDPEIFEEIEKHLNAKIEKANQISKIEPVEIIKM